MRIKSQRDFWSGLMFVIVGVVFAVGATNYRWARRARPERLCSANLWARMAQLSAHPGPGYFPLVLSLIMAILGAVVLFKSLTIETPGGDPIGDIAWRPLLVIVVAIAVFGAALERLGMVLTIPILIVISSLAGNEFRWRGVLHRRRAHLRLVGDLRLGPEADDSALAACLSVTASTR